MKRRLNFLSPEFVNEGTKIGWRFHFVLTNLPPASDPETAAISSLHMVFATISKELAAIWCLPFYTSEDLELTKKTLFGFSKDLVREMLEKGQELQDVVPLDLRSYDFLDANNNSKPLPFQYRPEYHTDPEGYDFEVEVEDRLTRLRAAAEARRRRLQDIVLYVYEQQIAHGRDGVLDEELATFLRMSGDEVARVIKDDLSGDFETNRMYGSGNKLSRQGIKLAERYIGEGLEGPSNLREFKHLRLAMKQVLILSDLQLLCADLKIVYEDMPSQGLENKILDIVQYCDRVDRIVDLGKWLEQWRPAVDWQSVINI